MLNQEQGRKQTPAPPVLSLASGNQGGHAKKEARNTGPPCIKPGKWQLGWARQERSKKHHSPPDLSLANGNQGGYAKREHAVMEASPNARPDPKNPAGMSRTPPGQRLTGSHPRTLQLQISYVNFLKFIFTLFLDSFFTKRIIEAIIQFLVHFK